MRIVAIGLSLFLAANTASACSYTYYVDEFTDFKSKPEDFYDKEAMLPRLRATVRLTHQPIAVDPRDEYYVHGCDNTAEFDIDIESEDAGFSPSAYGYYFRVVTRDAPWNSFNAVPIRPKSAEGGTARFSVSVSDSPLGPRAPINLEVEVFVIDSFMQIGPATRFRLQAAPPRVRRKPHASDIRESGCYYAATIAGEGRVRGFESRTIEVLGKTRKDGKFELLADASAGELLTCYRKSVVPDITDRDVINAGYRLVIRASGSKSVQLRLRRDRRGNYEYSVVDNGNLTRWEKARIRDILAVFNGGARISRADP